MKQRVYEDAKCVFDWPHSKRILSQKRPIDTITRYILFSSNAESEFLIWCSLVLARIYNFVLTGSFIDSSNCLFSTVTDGDRERTRKIIRFAQKNRRNNKKGVLLQNYSLSLISLI